MTKKLHPSVLPPEPATVVSLTTSDAIELIDRFGAEAVVICMLDEVETLTRPLEDLLALAATRLAVQYGTHGSDALRTACCEVMTQGWNDEGVAADRRVQ